MNNHIDYNEVVTIGYRDNGEPIRVTRGILRADGMEYILHRNAGKRRKKKASATKRSNNTNKNKEVNTTMNGETNNIKEAETMTKNTTNNNVGVEAMANENAINMDTKATVNAENNKETAIMGNSNVPKAAKMPKDELAAADELKLLTPNMPDFSSLVLPEEVADELTGKQDSVTRYRELGFFSPIRGMTNISNRLGGCLNARLSEDEKGQRRIEYVQKYVDGKTYSPIMSLSQASIRIAAKYSFSSKGIEEGKIRNRVSKFLLEAHDDYYGKFRGVLVDELDIADILDVLYEALPHLPINSESLTELEGETFYQLLDNQLKNTSSMSIHNHKSYYALEDGDIETLAGNMGMKKLELLKKMKQYDFLYLTPSSRGYQTNVRVRYASGKSDTVWRYCIYKLSYFADIEEVADDSLDLDSL